MNYQENRQSLNQRLTDKVQRELSSFREEMQAKTPQEIYGAAYQIAIKNEIAECFSSVDYSTQAAKALMKSPNLLQDIYEEWMEKDVSHAEELRQTVADVKAYMCRTSMKNGWKRMFPMRRNYARLSLMLRHIWLRRKRFCLGKRGDFFLNEK